MSGFRVIEGGRSQCPSVRTDIDTRIATVMLRLLQQEIDTCHWEQLQAHHAELRGTGLSEVQAFITARRRP